MCSKIIFLRCIIEFINIYLFKIMPLLGGGGEFPVFVITQSWHFLWHVKIAIVRKARKTSDILDYTILTADHLGRNLMYTVVHTTSITTLLSPLYIYICRMCSPIPFYLTSWTCNYQVLLLFHYSCGGRKRPDIHSCDSGRRRINR